MANRVTKVSTPVQLPKAEEGAQAAPTLVLGIKPGTMVDASQKLPESIRTAAANAVRAFWDGWFSKGGAADRLAALEAAREQFETTSRSLSSYIVRMGVDAYRINGPDVSKASNLFLSMCEAGEEALKTSAAWNESATVQSKEAKSLSEAIPQWKVYKSQIKAGIVAGVMAKLIESGAEITLYAINKAVKDAGGKGRAPQQPGTTAGTGKAPDTTGEQPATPAKQPTSAALDHMRTVLDGLYVTTAGDVNAQNVLAKHLSEAVSAFHKEMRGSEVGGKLDAVAA